MLRFGRELTSDPDALLRREWLVTNGIGGYAMGTPAGARTRRYHGLLVAALKPPTARTLLVASVDAWVEIDKTKHPLCTHEWTAGVLLPDGYRHLESFRLEGLIPTFTWTIGDVSIVQRIWMDYGKNTTYVLYEYQRGTRPIKLQLIPLCTYRDHHRNTLGGAAIDVAMSEVAIYDCATVQASEDLSRDPHAPAPQPFRLLCNADKAQATAEWWWSFRMSQETERGLTDHEDLFAAATFTKTLTPGQSTVLICTTETDLPRAWKDALAAERARQEHLLTGAYLDEAPVWIRQLALAADQFIVARTINKEKGTTIIAGYPWFSDWGRDTVIALPGLTLALRRGNLAERILRTFAHFIDQGMLPNRFPDDGEAPEYNTVDATLWYFEALRAYLAEHNDIDLVKFLYPKLVSIIEWHIKGTRYNIRVDPEDGLLYAGDETTQLTWMDVKIDDWAVTPRAGKPVEINALWYNALCIMRDLAVRLGNTASSHTYATMAQRVYDSFNQRFWYAKGGYCYDVIDTLDGDDLSLRPNQLIALSLPNMLLSEEKAKSVLDICARELVTSVGLRSLAPDHIDFIGHYSGDIPSRDGAYHQGTVWSWLIGPFVAAHYNVYKDAALAYSYLAPFEDHLMDAGLGSVSEVFEGDPPHLPKACIAQAWGVAEVLRVYRLLERGLNTHDS
ncbi:MAG: glycogen debranching enzyme family protein [Anaerolineae bacterium]|nr:glycogen debranching enzyme family protein [Anaerolineae bacterium]